MFKYIFQQSLITELVRDKILIPFRQAEAGDQKYFINRIDISIYEADVVWRSIFENKTYILSHYAIKGKSTLM